MPALIDTRSRSRGDDRRARVGPAPHERLAVFAIAARQAAPEMLDEIDRARAVSRGLRSRKCCARRRPNDSGSCTGCARRQRVHCVLHRVGRQHVAVVAVDVGCVVVAFEADRDASDPGDRGDRRRRSDLHEPDALLAVRRVSDHADSRNIPSRRGDDDDTPPFTQLADLASARVGGRAIAASDDFFAPQSNLRQAAARRLRRRANSRRAASGWTAGSRGASATPGHDWCVDRSSGMRGAIRGVDVDTQLLHRQLTRRTVPSTRSTSGGRSSQPTSPAGTARPGRRSSPKSPLQRRPRQSVRDRSTMRRSWTHLRLNIFPDGGVARLRVTARRSSTGRGSRARAGRSISRRSANGGLVLGASDMHFGAKDNMIMPGPRGEHGRRLGDAPPARPGLRLGDRPARRAAGSSAPRRDRHEPLQGQLSGQRVARGLLRCRRDTLATWRRSTGSRFCRETKLRPHHRHLFYAELTASGPVSHVRLNIFPDGGVSRLRVHGTLAPA